MGDLSVVVSVFNGGKYLNTCLFSISHIAQEIIIVDHDSSDNTLEIAKKYTKKIYKKENNPGAIDLQKNFGFEKATHQWILSLDADEHITSDLAKEIEGKIVQNSVDGYFIPRKNIIFGKEIGHTGWYPDYQLRLFKNGKGKYASAHVHEDLIVEGNIEKLNHPIIHEAYQNVYQFLHRGLTVYAPNEAKEMIRKGYTFSFADALRFPFREFLSRFFAREGYKDGFHGLMLSLLMSFYHFAVFCYLWKHEKFREQQEILALLKAEIKKSKEELQYWMDTEKIAKTTNPATKVILKIKRKFKL